MRHLIGLYLSWRGALSWQRRAALFACTFVAVYAGVLTELYLGVPFWPSMLVTLAIDLTLSNVLQALWDKRGHGL